MNRKYLKILGKLAIVDTAATYKNQQFPI